MNSGRRLKQHHAFAPVDLVKEDFALIAVEVRIGGPFGAGVLFLEMQLHGSPGPDGVVDGVDLGNLLPFE